MKVFKRGKFYHYRFTVRRKPYRGSTEMTNQRKAQEFAEDLKEKMKRRSVGLDVIQDEITMDELFDLYLPDFKERAKSTTYHVVSTNIDSLFRPVLGDIFVNDLAITDINKFITKQKTKGNKGNTINSKIRQLRAIINWGIKEGYHNNQVMMKVKAEKEGPLKTPVISDEEFSLICSKLPPWAVEMAYLEWESGLRRQNIVLLKWSQVHLNYKVPCITIDGGEMKGSKPHTFPLNTVAQECFRRKSKIMHINSDFVFCKKDGLPYALGTLTNNFYKATRALGLKYCFNDLRHTFASVLVQNGTPLYHVQKLMGHANSKMTERYAHLEVEHLAPAVENLRHKSTTLIKGA